MLQNASDFDFESASPFEICIVGAGAVGLTLAVSLARQGKRVALLEAGPAKPQASSQMLFEAATYSGHELRGLHVGRFRTLGGSTTFWGGQLVPFAPIVFQPRPWVSNAFWPISLNDVSPFYKDTFNILGMPQVIESDDDVWAALKVPAPVTTDAIKPFFTRWTPESNLAIHFNADITANPNLTVLLEAQVGALANDGEGKITGAQVRFRDGARKLLKARHFILANGTIEISRLLQLPDHDGQPAPWAGNQWIGHAFMDHVDCYAGQVRPYNRRRFSDLFDNAFINRVKYVPKLRLNEPVQIREQLLEISAHFVFNSSLAEHITNLKTLIKGLLKGRVDKSTTSNPLGLLSSLHFIVPMAMRYIRYRRMTNFTDGGILLRLTSEQSPIRDSRIRLTDEPDAFGIPKVDVDWRIDAANIDTFARFAQLMKEYLEEQELASVDIYSDLRNRDVNMLARADDSNHHMGGARMATSADQGVVDTNCKVFGTSNLYVAGAAVYPVSGFANPTFHAIAMGLRIGAYILAQE